MQTSDEMLDEFLELWKNKIVEEEKENIILDFRSSEDGEKYVGEYMREYPYIEIRAVDGDLCMCKGIDGEENIIQRSLTKEITSIIDGLDQIVHDEYLLKIEQGFKKLSTILNDGLEAIELEKKNRGLLD